MPEGFNVLVKELQGLGLKVDLLDNGKSEDASDVIEKTSREIEKTKDDQIIYATHQSTENLSDEEMQEVLDDNGVQITEGDDEGTVDLGEEF